MPRNLHHAQEFLRQQLGPGVLNRDSEALAAIAFVSTIEEAVREADLVIDCVPDELESKLEILWLLDRMAPPRTVLATPTTRLSIADLANCTYRPEKCIAIAAEANSLTGKPAAEASRPITRPGAEILLRTTTRTAPETVTLAGDFWRQLGFTPVFEVDPAEPTPR
jgi:3-hydroxybutyryl-CoA dehydrogenase